MNKLPYFITDSAFEQLQLKEVNFKPTVAASE